MTNPRYPKYFLFVLIAFLTSLIYLLLSGNPISRVPDIATFEECVAAGYPVMESYPERCATPEGRTFTRVTTDLVPSPVALTGTYTCLPKKDTGGPVTLECAFGLKTSSGYYALDMSAILSDNYPSLTGNEKITVEGTLVPIEMVSSDRFQAYDVVGVIAVEKIRKH